MSIIERIGTSTKFIPKLLASFSASDILSLLVICEGIETPVTLSFPRASVNNTAHTVESKPPDNPSTARFIPHFLK